MISPFPLVLSLSKDASGLEAWFDKLTTNGKFDGLWINGTSSEVQHV